MKTWQHLGVNNNLVSLVQLDIQLLDIEMLAAIVVKLGPLINRYFPRIF